MQPCVCFFSLRARHSQTCSLLPAQQKNKVLVLGCVHRCLFLVSFFL